MARTRDPKTGQIFDDGAAHVTAPVTVATQAEIDALSLTTSDAGVLYRNTDTGNLQQWNGASWDVVETAGASHVADKSIIAGARNPSSTTTSYLVIREECNLSVISKQTAVTIGGGVANDTHLMGLQITAALTGTCVIAGFADSDDAATSITLPAATPAGFIDFKGAINAAGALTVTASNAGDDDLISVLWRPA